MCPIDRFIRYARSKGLIISVSAGNSDIDACLTSPADSPDVITVACMILCQTKRRNLKTKNEKQWLLANFTSYTDRANWPFLCSFFFFFFFFLFLFLFLFFVYHFLNYSYLAHGSTGYKSSFSNFGKCVDVYAPGERIKSTYIGSTSAVASLSGTRYLTFFFFFFFWKTKKARKGRNCGRKKKKKNDPLFFSIFFLLAFLLSMSAPVVGGILATMLEQNSYLTLELALELLSTFSKSVYYTGIKSKPIYHWNIARRVWMSTKTNQNKNFFFKKKKKNWFVKSNPVWRLWRKQPLVLLTAIAFQ